MKDSSRNELFPAMGSPDKPFSMAKNDMLEYINW